MNAKIVSVAGGLLVIGVAGYLLSGVTRNPDESPGSDAVRNTSGIGTKSETTHDGASDFLLSGYPSDTVPLHGMTRLQSMKYFVNDDPKSFRGFTGTSVNYYNVVFDTDLTRDDILGYYRSLMEKSYPEESSDTMIVGRIGKYVVSAAFRGEKTVYLSVYLPDDEFRKENPYYDGYPSDLVEIPVTWIEHENSYGTLNQRGGQTEYTRYFVLDEEASADGTETNPFTDLYNRLKERYASQADFVANDGQHMLSWESEGYEITLTFSEDHGRIYLMIRTAL